MLSNAQISLKQSSRPVFSSFPIQEIYDPLSTGLFPPSLSHIYSLFPFPSNSNYKKLELMGKESYKKKAKKEHIAILRIF